MASNNRAKDPHQVIIDHFAEQIGRLRRARWRDWHLARSHFSGLSWTKWLVLFIMGAIVVAVELHHHARMWQEMDDGQTFWSDPTLLWEILLFGLILPIAGGIVFGSMERIVSEKENLAGELQLRRDTLRQIQSAPDRHELFEIVVTIPGAISAAERAWLLTTHPDGETFAPAAYWERRGTTLKPTTLPVVPNICEQCMQPKTLEGSRLMVCPNVELADGHGSLRRYCLWLSSAETQRVSLIFDVPFAQPLAPAQVRQLDEIGDEISLTLENVLLLDLHQHEIDSAREERLRIARDLHDTLGQNIGYLRLKLEQLGSAPLVADGRDFQDTLTRMLAVANESYSQVRDTLDELRGTEQLDVAQAVDEYAAQISVRAGFSVELQSQGTARALLPRQSRQIIYIAREALNNVEKHAGATEVRIVLQWYEDEFMLSVRDDGVGFQPLLAKSSNKYGLVIMGERARAIGAHLDIRAAPGEGAEMILHLPLPSSGVGPTRGS